MPFRGGRSRVVPPLALLASTGCRRSRAGFVSWRSAPPRAVAADDDHAVWSAPAVTAGRAGALGEEGRQAGHLRLAAPKGSLVVDLCVRPTKAAGPRSTRQPPALCIFPVSPSPSGSSKAIVLTGKIGLPSGQSTNRNNERKMASKFF